MKKIDISSTTFLIPIRIDSEDRKFNFRYVINYLCTNLITNIIIKESDVCCKTSKLLEDINPGQTKITHLFERNEKKVFHRTRLLNEMLEMATTPVVANYDIDVLLLPQTYLEAQNEIIDANYDLIYPYFKGLSQKRVYTGNWKFDIIKLYDIPSEPWNSICGHCQFFKTSSYIRGGAENENFISWGPEDSERMHRFVKLGYKLKWLTNYIWHIEHERGINSEEKNPHFWDNKRLYEHLINLPEHELKDYYNNVEYLKKYDKFTDIFR